MMIGYMHSRLQSSAMTCSSSHHSSCELPACHLICLHHSPLPFTLPVTAICLPWQAKGMLPACMWPDVPVTIQVACIEQLLLQSLVSAEEQPAVMIVVVTIARLGQWIIMQHTSNQNYIHIAGLYMYVCKYTYDVNIVHIVKCKLHGYIFSYLYVS